MSERVPLHKFVWISVVALIPLGSCAFSASEENPSSACVKYAQSLRQVHADDKASADWLSDKKGFLGVYGYSSEFPPLDKMEPATREKLLDSYGFEMVEGTTDDIRDEGCSNFQTAARDYAERYNRKKLEFISRDGPSR